MKILQVIPYFTFSRGGDVNVCYNLAKQLTEKGHDVTIITTTFEYNKEDTDKIKNLTMVPIPYKSNKSLYISSPEMKDWLEENLKDYDIIHLHELRSYQNKIVREYALRYDIPYIVQPHASTPTNVGNRILKKVFDLFYGKKIMKDADMVIAVSEEEAYYDYKMDAKKINIIYNGMNVDKYEILPPEGTFKDKYNINSPYILYLGRLDKLKGIDILISAFSELDEKYDKYKLVIAGKENKYQKSLAKLAKDEYVDDRVIFTGFIPEEDKISIYRDATLFINPVKYMGGVSITVLESVLANTPVIVTPESGEIIAKTNSGIVVPYGDIPELTDAIEKALKNKKTGKKQVRNGQKFIKEKLPWPTVADYIIKVYKDTIDKVDEK
jgi:glycosyltransferase involved in cell wall biosynthesis